LEVVAKLSAALPEEFWAVVALVAGSGLRQGEVFGLEVDHLDFLHHRSVEVVQQLVTLPGRPPYLAGPKTAESVRTVPLAAVTLDHLAAHLVLRDVDLGDGRDSDVGDVRGCGNPAGRGPAGCGGARVSRVVFRVSRWIR